VGSLFALFEGVEKLRHPHELESPAIAIVILLLAIVFEIFSFRTAIIESAHVKGDESWWSFVRHTKTPELPVVLLEDLGALVGLVLALFGVGLAELTGNPRFDAVGSMAIGALLGVIAVLLMIEMKSLLIGESASAAVDTRIRRVLEAGPGVRSVIHLRTQHLGPDELLVGAKLEFDDTLDVDALCAGINRLEQAVRESVPEARVMYLEPDIARVAPDQPGP
jgi:divalent metal cation (Fe/Co/Zn/Cd) transporter